MGIEWEMLFLVGAALIAGGINAIAGGGGLLVFPSLLLAGIAPVSANATGAAGIWIGMLFSGIAYRQELTSVASKLWPVTLASLAGGGLGAWLLLNFSDEGFAVMVPYLVATGTLIFALAPRLKKLSLDAQPTDSLQLPTDHQPALNQPALIIGQGIISTYGGFFGGGAGILMLTLLSLTNTGKLQTLQSIKIWMALCINAAALSYFVFVHIIAWPYALLIAIGTSLGGYSSVYWAKRVSALWLRRMVIAIGSALTLYFFAIQQ